MDFFVSGKPLKEQFKLEMSIPDRATSTIKILANKGNVIKFQLRLADDRNKPIETLDQPEILMDGGHGTLEGVKKMAKGIWEFNVVYPEVNQIMYFSVRSQGILLQKLLRYQ
jgi:hypothetical protein